MITAIKENAALNAVLTEDGGRVSSRAGDSVVNDAGSGSRAPIR